MFLFVLAGIFIFGLGACQLPASKGPQSNSDGFPVPASSEQASGLDVTRYATQTAQVLLPGINQAPRTPVSTNTSAIPAATKTPSAPAPTATPIVYVQPTEGSLPTSYTLQEGEFPFCIARRFDVSLSELLSLNGLALDTLVSPGQSLQIPQTGNPFEGPRALHEHPTEYQIQTGDTINSIACYFGDVSPEMIIKQNNLTVDNWGPGDVIIIP